MGPGDETEGDFWSPYEIDQSNSGSPYLHESDSPITERSDDVPNPREWEPVGNPNEDLYDAPNQANDVTDVGWMD